MPIVQEYLAQWVAKVAAAEKEYRNVTKQMNRPALPGSAQPQTAAGGDSGVHQGPGNTFHVGLIPCTALLLNSNLSYKAIQHAHALLTLGRIPF